MSNVTLNSPRNTVQAVLGSEYGRIIYKPERPAYIAPPSPPTITEVDEDGISLSHDDLFEERPGDVLAPLRRDSYDGSTLAEASPTPASPASSTACSSETPQANRGCLAWLAFFWRACCYRDGGDGR